MYVLHQRWSVMMLFCFLVSSVTKGKHMVPVLNSLNIDVAVYGNHDFGEFKILLPIVAQGWMGEGAGMHFLQSVPWSWDASASSPLNHPLCLNPNIPMYTLGVTLVLPHRRYSYVFYSSFHTGSEVQTSFEWFYWLLSIKRVNTTWVKDGPSRV